MLNFLAQINENIWHAADEELLKEIQLCKKVFFLFYKEMHREEAKCNVVKDNYK